MRIGIDIGGTKTDAVVVDAAGGVAARIVIPTTRGEEGVVETALRAVRALEGELGARTGGGAAGAQAGAGAGVGTTIGIGIPGIVDPARGVVEHAFNLGVRDLSLGRRVAEATGAVVRLENDVKAAALGAALLNGAAGSVAYLNLGTGLGCAVVRDGVVERGAQGIAGEIGHVPVDPNGIRCPCGMRGCLETIASGSGILRMRPSDAELPAVDLFDAADDGDADALAVRARFVDGVAQCIRLVVLSADPERIVIGGGLRHLGDRLMDEVRRVVDRWGEESSFLGAARLAERVALLPADTAAPALGAALVGDPAPLRPVALAS